MYGPIAIGLKMNERRLRAIEDRVERLEKALEEIHRLFVIALNKDAEPAFLQAVRAEMAKELAALKILEEHRIKSEIEEDLK